MVRRGGNDQDDFEGCRLRAAWNRMPRRRRRGGDASLATKLQLRKLFQATDGIERLITKVENREHQQRADFVEFTTTDAWLNCMDIVSSAMEDNCERETHQPRGRTSTTLATGNHDHGDEDHVKACNHGTWGYWEENWTTSCADPCCNIDKQRGCVAPQDVPVDVFRPTFNTQLVANVGDQTPRRVEASRYPQRHHDRGRACGFHLQSWRDLKSVSQRSSKCRRKPLRCRKISNAAFAPPSENGRTTTSSTARCLAPLTRLQVSGTCIGPRKFSSRE